MATPPKFIRPNANKFTHEFAAFATLNDEIKVVMTVQIYQHAKTDEVVVWILTDEGAVQGHGKAKRYDYALQQAIENADFEVEKIMFGNAEIRKAIKEVCLANGYPDVYIHHAHG